MNQSIDETLPQCTTFTSSPRTHLGVRPHFQVACTQSPECKERDLVAPDVHVALDKDTVSLTTHKGSILATTKPLRTNNISNLVSPISNLPTEILAYIFILAVDSCRSSDDSTHRRDLLISLVDAISRVCSFWHFIAINTGQLWSHIDLEMLGHIDYVRLWLERAGNFPLDIVENYPPEPSIHYKHGSTFSLAHPHIKCVRSMILSTDAHIMEQWLSGWYNNGVPHTLTTLALHANDQMMKFPVPGEAVTQQRLNELFCSLDTLYLCFLRFNLDVLRCQNLVTLSLLRLRTSINAIGNLLLANPKLQYIHILHIAFPDTTEQPSVQPTRLPLIRLDQLHTLRLEDINAEETTDILAMIAPGNSALALTIRPCNAWGLEAVLGHEFLAFCQRSHLTKLHCSSYKALQDAVAIAPKLEVLVLDCMALCSSLYNLIVPPANDWSPSEHTRPRLPHLHTIIALSCRIRDAEDFRRVISACPIREIRVNAQCFADGERISTIQDFKSWVGPGVTAACVLMERELGYAPFGRQ